MNEILIYAVAAGIIGVFLYLTIGTDRDQHRSSKRKL